MLLLKVSVVMAVIVAVRSVMDKTIRVIGTIHDENCYCEQRVWLLSVLLLLLLRLPVVKCTIDGCRRYSLVCKCCFG